MPFSWPMFRIIPAITRLAGILPVARLNPETRRGYLTRAEAMWCLICVKMHAGGPPGERAGGDLRRKYYSTFLGPVLRADKDEHRGSAVKLPRKVVTGYVIWWAALVALYYGRPGLRAETWGLIVLSGVGGIVAGVVMSRLSDVAASHGRALGRERAVREAGAALVSAITVEQAGAAVRSATDTLLGRGPRGDVLLAVRTDGAVRAVATASADPAPMSRLTDLAEGWLPLVTGSAPVLAPVTSLPAPAAAIVPGYDCDAAVPAHPGRPAVGRSARRGARGVRCPAHPRRPRRHAGDPRAPGGPRGGADHPARGTDPPGQRGVLPHPGPGHLGRHLDRGRRREGQVRDAVGGQHLR